MLRRSASKRWPESVASSTAFGMTLFSWIHHTLVTGKEVLKTVVHKASRIRHHQHPLLSVHKYILATSNVTNQLITHAHTHTHNHTYKQQQNSSSLLCKRQPWRWLVEHVIFPTLRTDFIPQTKMAEDGSVLEIANLHELYKVFERC